MPDLKGQNSASLDSESERRVGHRRPDWGTGSAGAYRASRLAWRRCPLDRIWPWIAVAWLFRNGRLAALAAAVDRTAFRRLAVLDSAAAADASWFGAVTRDDAFLLRFMSAPPCLPFSFKP